MDYVLGFFSFLFVAMVIGCALFFGMVILMWLMGAVLALAAFFYVREFIRRRLFIYNAAPTRAKSRIEVIEAEYTDITDKR